MDIHVYIGYRWYTSTIPSHGPGHDAVRPATAVCVRPCHLAFHGSFSHMNTVSNYRGPSQLGSSVSIVLEWNILGSSFTLTQLYKFEKDLITCLTYPSCLQSWNWVKGFSQCRVQLIEHHVCNSQTTTNRGHLHRVVPGAGKVRVSRLQPSLDPIHFQELLDHIGNLIG